MSTSEKVDLLVESLNQLDTTQGWQKILEPFFITGVMDSRQMQQASGFNRDKTRRLIEKMQQAARGQAAIIYPLERSIPRPGQRGRAPVVYLLGENGAAILRSWDFDGVRACRLQEDTPLLHALAMVDFHLAAEISVTNVWTDKVLTYGSDKKLRPDHQVSLIDGTLLMFEMEQRASPAILRRIMDSLRHKHAFFSSKQGSKFEPRVRMLFNLPRGETYQKTLRIWRQAWQLMLQEKGGKAPFELCAMPLGEFLRRPDWGYPEELSRWDGMAIPAKAETTLAESKPGKPPRSLIVRSPKEDRYVMQALWQNFLENVNQQNSNYPQPCPEFFELMDIIFSASQSRQHSPLAQAAMPWAGIYLLGQYLRAHPELRSRLNKTIRRGNRNLRWNATTILHHMQVVINTFLAYHGFRSDGKLRVYAGTASWEGDMPRTFNINVKIYTPDLLMVPGEQVVPGKDEVRQAEQALRWVLISLFKHAHLVGLSEPTYW